MTALWPCDQCGAAGVRNVGTRGYCWVHAGELFASFVTFTGMPGIGLPTGVPEVAGIGTLRCSACSATWIGAIGEGCAWCHEHLATMVEHEVELLLTPPARTDEAALVAWAARMHVAVEAGVVTADQARRAYRKVVRHDRAA